VEKNRAVLERKALKYGWRRAMSTKAKTRCSYVLDAE
jgi:hypothetical protein